jgi:6-phosphofructokinase 1
MITCLSSTDGLEAEEAGRSAVQHAIKGYSDVMVTLLRNTDGPYICTTGISPLKDIAGVEKKMPDEYYNTSDYMVTSKFIDYATPLIGKPLPHFNRF